MFKLKQALPQSQNSSIKQIQPVQQIFVVEKIARIDGQQTIKKYKRCELLGKGGFANCFVTQNTQTKKRAATKIIEKQLLNSQKTKLRLLNQIRLHKTLHHQNIVEFQHYFQDKNNVFIFLELCQNQSLNEVIKVRQFFSTPQIQSFIYGIVQGLKYLHGKSIIHRDLKLGNIFLDKKFNIKLGDFGLATKLQFRKQCKRTICGTPNYIAPQILQGKGYHFQIDIWSIGVILYTLFYTIPPFQTEEASTTYQKIKKCQYVFPKNMFVPNEAIDLIRRILVKNPSQRPTLDDILKSDFMKFGNKIYKELPSICSKRMPNKKDFANLPYLTHIQTLQQIKRQASDDKFKLKGQIESASQIETKLYLTHFQSLGDQKYFYILNNEVCSIVTPAQVIFKDQYGVIQCFNPNEKVKKLKTCEENPLKYLLNCKTKLKNMQTDSSNSLKLKDKEILLEATLYPSEIPLHIKKVSEQLKHNFYMVRLSNQTIQLVFEDLIDYLIDGNGQQIYKIKNGKVRQTLFLNQKFVLSQNNSKKIQENKLKYVNGVLNQIKVMKQKIISKDQLKQNQQQEKQQILKSQKINFEINNVKSGQKKLKSSKSIPKQQLLFKQIKN